MGREMGRVLTIHLAGGAGEHVNPLTREYVLTLDQPTLRNAPWDVPPPEQGAFAGTLPPMKRNRDTWRLGTAAAVYQNLARIAITEVEAPRTPILSAGRVHKMNCRGMPERHSTRQAGVTRATARVTPDEAGRPGIVSAGRKHGIAGFDEQPDSAIATRPPFDADRCVASPGARLFSKPAPLAALFEDAEDSGLSHDSGRDAPPLPIHSAKASACPAGDENRMAPRRWRDIGTLDAYYEANVDLTAVNREFNVYVDHWPPPAKFAFGDAPARMGMAIDSLPPQGRGVSGSRVVRNAHSLKARVNSHSEAEVSVTFENVSIGSNRDIRRAIVEGNLEVPAGYESGQPPDADRRGRHCATDSASVALHAESPGLPRKREPGSLIHRRPASGAAPRNGRSAFAGTATAVH